MNRDFLKTLKDLVKRSYGRVIEPKLVPVLSSVDMRYLVMEKATQNLFDFFQEHTEDALFVYNVLGQLFPVLKDLYKVTRMRQKDPNMANFMLLEKGEGTEKQYRVVAIDFGFMRKITAEEIELLGEEEPLKEMIHATFMQAKRILARDIDGLTDLQKAVKKFLEDTKDSDTVKEMEDAWKEVKDMLQPVAVFAEKTTMEPLRFEGLWESAKTEVPFDYKDIVNTPPGSKTTYGETNIETIARLITEFAIGPENKVLDVGMGIGNVVLSFAYMSGCAAAGIEIVKVSANISRRLYDKVEDFLEPTETPARVRLYYGNFLDFAESFAIFDTVFAHDTLFREELRAKLFDIVATHCNVGTTLISTHDITPPRWEEKARKPFYKGHQQHFFTPSQKLTIENAVSWKAGPFNYYFYRVVKQRKGRTL